MKFKSLIIAAFAVALSCAQAFGQATILPPGETCFSGTAGINGMVGVLGTITGGNSYTNGTYGGVPLTGGSGSNATANITVSGGIVTQVTILNPGIQYVIGDVLSAAAANIGGTGSGFSVPVSSTSINSSLAGGSVGFYVPNNFPVFKQTWQNAGETVLNQNPVPLDQNGCAVIYGAGVYLMVVNDSLGNTVYSKLTASTSPQGVFWAGLAGGTGNAITITDTAFANQDGATIQFLASAANTGPVTISVSGGAQIALVKDTSSGPAALSGGEIGIGNTPMITYDATNVEFHIVNPAATSGSGSSTSSLTPPQGYLNLVGAASGSVVQGATDVTAASTVYYSPYIGNTVPIWNGSVFKQIVFTELTATLTSSGSPSSVIQDACVFSNNGVPTLAIGPQWTTATAGSGNRGTGAGTPQLTRLQGIWVNSVTIVGYNGLSSYSIPANQCTYVGSLSIDATAGQVSAYRTWGQSRKFGVWNAYNRQPITMIEGDSTSTWSYSSSTFRQSNGSANNFIAVFTGLPEETFSLTFSQNITAPNNVNGVFQQIGIGVNSTTVTTGFVPHAATSIVSVGTMVEFLVAGATVPPTLGINNINALEALVSGSGAGNYIGGSVTNMQLSASYRG